MGAPRQQRTVNLVASRIMTTSRRRGGADGNHLEQTTAETEVGGRTRIELSLIGPNSPLIGEYDTTIRGTLTAARTVKGQYPP